MAQALLNTRDAASGLGTVTWSMFSNCWQIRSETQPITWLVELRDHWRSQSSGVFGGWIHPKLDDFLTDDKRREVVLGMLNEIRMTPGLSREAHETAQLFEALLRGQLHTDESSKLDYMVSGPHPYEWSLRNQSKMRDRSEESTQ